MKGTKAIKDKIKKEAAATTRKLRGAARKQVKEYDEKQKAFQKDYKEGFEERTERLLEDLKQKKLAQARLDVKKKHLQAREDIINDIIADVIDNLDHGSEKYRRLLKDTLEENLSSFSGNVTVVCSPEDVDAVKEIVGQRATTEEDATIEGGVIMEDDTGKRIDESLGTLLERSRGRIRQGIAGVLS